MKKLLLEKTIKRLKKHQIIIFISILIILIGVIEKPTWLYDRFIKSDTSINISGKWELVNTLTDAGIKSDIGKKYKFHMTLVGHNNKITGSAEKISVNDVILPPTDKVRSTIEINGYLNKNIIIANFQETGPKRLTIGTFNWKISSDNKTLKGKFSSTADNTEGISIAIKKD